MKKLITQVMSVVTVVTLLIPAGATFATGAQNLKCEDFGFDIRVAEIVVEGGSVSVDVFTDAYHVTAYGNEDEIEWDATPAVAGGAAKAATNWEDFAGGTNGSMSKAEVGTGVHGLSHIILCANEEQPEEPEVVTGCTDEDAHNYNEDAEEDDGSCEYPELPEETECVMLIEKEVDTTATEPGAALTYTIDVESAGTGDCTGGGVRVFDWLDDNFIFVSATVSDNASAGYESLPLYSVSEHLVRFNAHTLEPGETASFTITGVVAEPAQCGDFEIVNKAKTTAFELNHFQDWVYSDEVVTEVANDCAPEVVPGCTDADALNYNDDATEDDGSCEYRNPAPVCESFTANVSTLPSTGGDVTLSWDTTNATDVTIYPHLGVVEADGTGVAAITASTKFLLTATNLDGVDTTCDATVVIEPEPEVFTCSNNVVFSAANPSITEGETSTLTWNVTGADSVAISGVNATTATGSVAVSPTTNTTYTLTATSGNDSIDCTAAVAVSPENTSSGGGGGGSASLRCDLEASQTSISAGEEVTLTWDTRGAREVTLFDDANDVVFTTDDFLSADKSDYFDHEVTVTPTTNTTYTLMAERGRRDRECSVTITVDDIVTYSTVTQEPLVTAISLSEVPYTGATNTIVFYGFYALLALWAGYIAFVFMARGTVTAGPRFSPNEIAMQRAAKRFPQLFV